jgi:hypothetical protein
MKLDKKPDIPKIAFAGVPILLIWWGLVFIALAFTSRDPMISKDGSISIFVLSIPIYGFFAIKYASKLGATIDTEEQTIRNSNVNTQGLKRHVTKFDLWFAGIFILAMPLYFFIGQYVLGLSEDQLTGHIKWIFLFAIFLELLLRKKFGIKNK